MYFIILAITVFINVTLVAVPQDRPVFVTKIVKGRKCGHAKKKNSPPCTVVCVFQLCASPLLRTQTYAL